MKKSVSLSAAELKKLFDRLITDLVEAGGHARLVRALGTAQKNYEKEINQTRAFWNFTSQGLREGCMMRLARVYDQHDDALSLLTLLQIIGRHTHLFEDDSVLQRVSSAYAEEFKAGSHRIDPARLAADIELVSSTDPLVNRLFVWRSNYGAHLSKKPILKGGIRGRVPLGEKDIFELVDRAFDIYNRYLIAFEGASFSRKIIGEDDYEFLFRLLRLGLEAFEAEIDKVPS